MIVLGVDPDTRGSGVSLVYVDLDHVDLIETVTCVNPDLSARGEVAVREQAKLLSFEIEDMLLRHGEKIDLAVVERQEVYKQGRANANNLVTLANITGVALGACCRMQEDPLLPLPKTWKGNQPKGITWDRVLQNLRVQYQTGDAKGLVKPKLNWPRGARVEVVPQFLGESLDSIGLAIWGGRKALGKRGPLT